MPQLLYFDVYGKAEPVRIMLNHAKVAFEDVRMTGEQFQARKTAGDLPSGQLPVWVSDDGKIFN